MRRRAQAAKGLGSDTKSGVAEPLMAVSPERRRSKKGEWASDQGAWSLHPSTKRGERKGEWQSAKDRQVGLNAEAVEGAAVSLEGVDDVERSDRLPLGVLGVPVRRRARLLGRGSTLRKRKRCERDRVADNLLQEDLQDAARLLVDQTGDVSSPPFLRRMTT